MVFSARPDTANDALARLNWQDFEHLLAEHYREQGFRVEVLAANGLKSLGAPGLDMRLSRGSEHVIVKCRHWDAMEVDVGDVNELISAMLHEAATRGILVTRGRYLPAAMNAVRRQPRIQLLDGDMLRVLLKLPDHLDTAPPGTRPIEKVQRKADAVRRRSSGSGARSVVLPVMMVTLIAVLLGVFVWRAMNHGGARDLVAAASPAPAAPVAPAGTDAPVETPPSALPPQAMASVTHGSQPALSPTLAHELAARERARQDSDDASRHKGDDAMKVMERNTREVGSY